MNRNSNCPARLPDSSDGSPGTSANGADDELRAIVGNIEPPQPQAAAIWAQSFAPPPVRFRRGRPISRGRKPSGHKFGAPRSPAPS